MNNNKYNVGDKIIFKHKKEQIPGEILKINKNTYRVMFKLEDFKEYNNSTQRYMCLNDPDGDYDHAWRCMPESKILRLQ